MPKMPARAMLAARTVSRLEETLMERANAAVDGWHQWGLWAGVGYAILQVAALVLFGATIAPALPPIDAGADAYAALYADKAGETMLLLYLAALSLPLLIAFLVSLGDRLRTSTEAGSLATAALLAGLAMALIPLGANVVEARFGTTLALSGGDPLTVKAIDGLIPVSISVGALPRALLLGVVAIGVLHAAMAARWLGWAALLLVVVSLVGSLTVIAQPLFAIALIGTLLFALWVLALAIDLLRRPLVRAETRS